MAKTISRKELAEKLGVSPNTIYRYEADGKAPVMPTKLRHNGHVRYPEEAIRIYLAWMSEPATE